MKNKKAIILFDGFCKLCNRTVRFLIKRDKKKVFEFKSLQSEKGQQIIIDKHLSDIESVVFVYGNLVYTRSDAFIEIARLLPFPWNWLRIAKIIPRKWRDYIYAVIAKYRYQWFGKYESCKIVP